MSDKRRVIINTLANGIAQFAAVLSALVFMPFLIKGFGKTDYGLYLLASSVVGYANLLDFGVGTSLVKLTAEAHARDDRSELGRLTSSTLAFYVGVGVVVAAILVVFALNTRAFFHVDVDGARLLRNLFFVAAANSLLAWPANTGPAVLGGFQRYTQTARTALATTIGTIAMTALIVLLHEGPVVLMLGTAAVTLAGGLVNAAMAGRALHGVHVSLLHVDVAGLRRIFSISWVVFVVQLCTIIVYQQTDRLVLGVFVGAVAITLYDAAGKFQGLMAQLSTFSVSAVMPTASQLDAEDRRDAIRTLFIRGTKYSLALMAPISVVLMVVARPLLTAWLGPTFSGQALAAQILISHQVLTSGLAVGSSMIVGLGQLKRRLPYVVAFSALNLAISLTLVRSLGIIGVVLGTAIPYFIDFPLNLRLTLKIVGVPISRWLREIVLPVYPLLALPLIVALALSATSLASSLAGIACVGIVSVGAYWLALFAFGLRRSEREEVRGALNAVVARVRGNAG